MVVKLKSLLISLAISLGTGILSSIFTMGSMNIYKSINKPMLSPPSWLFPIVWTVLFILMGVSSYIIYESKSLGKNASLKVYILQLIFNFIWPIIFFNARLYLFSFLLLIILWILILTMILLFYRVNNIAAYLQVPYLLWVTFAGYLNFMIYILNR